jgi:protein TonB
MKSLLILYFGLCSYSSFSQDKNSFYALDAKMNQTVLDSSKYILWIHEKDDSNWQWDYYYTWGPMIKSHSFADHDGTIPNGAFYIYDTGGNLDSMGYYDHGKKNGSFYKLKSYTSDSIVVIKQYDFAEDSLIKMISPVTARNDKNDSVRGTEAEYPGGQEKWYAYLTHNLRYPERAIPRQIQGRVMIHFMIDEEGNLKDPYIQKSLEYSLDQETIRIFKNSGLWVPGEQNGVRIKTYKLMPLIYKLETQ